MKKIALFFLLLITNFSFVKADETASLKDRLDAAGALYFSSQPLEALKEYIQISKETSNKDAFLNAAFIAMEQSNPKQAVDIALAAYKIYPQDRDVTEFLAQAYLADGQYSSAEKLFSQLPTDEMRNDFLHISLARTQMGLGERDLAKYNLKLAANGQTNTALANYLLGLLYEEDKEYSQAAEAFQKATKYDHQFIEARKHYAFCLEKVKDYNEAYKQYRMIYSADKTSKDVSDAITRLKKLVTRKEKDSSSTPTAPKTLKHTSVKALENDSASQIVKIGIGTKQNGRPSVRNSVEFIPSHKFKILNSNGKLIVNGKAKELWKVVLQKNKLQIISPKGATYIATKHVTIVPDALEKEIPTIIVKKVMSGAGMTWASVDDKEYRGKLQILHSPKLGTIIPINIVTLEEYLQGVITSEMPAQFPDEALKSQAVLARTYALKHIHKHKAYGYDLCDTQNCQVYGGVKSENDRANDAVDSTAGEILTYDNTPIESVFSANCGGITQSSKDAGWSKTPYLNPVSDYKDFDFSNLQPYHFKELLQYHHDAYSRYDKNVSLAAFRWVRVVEEQELRTVIKRQKKDIGTILAIVPQARAKSGYVSRILVKGTKGTVTLSKENVIRNNLSLGLLRSSYFIVEPHYEKRKLKRFVFYGGGWGHGVGFCQTGAAGRADDGQDYKMILNHYFPLATLETKNTTLE